MKVVISGFYGLGNTGDEAILASMISSLRSEIPDIDITVFSHSVEDTARTHGVKTVYRGWKHDFPGKVAALRKADLLISGGGGLLQDTWPTRIIRGPLPYYLLIVFLAKLCGAKVMFFSQGIGPVTTRYGKLLMRIFANMADFITVRDPYSKELLHKLGVTRPETVVTSDIALALHIEPDRACIESLELVEGAPLVAVSLRQWFEYVKHYDDTALILDELIQREQVIPVFVPMEGKLDYEASREAMGKMKLSESCHLLDHHFTPNQFVNFFKECKLTIGMRLHSLIFSALSGIPHIGLSYDEKVESFLKQSGMWDFSFHLLEVEPKKLVSHAQTLLHDHDHYREIVEKQALIMRKEAMRNAQLLKEKFGSYVERTR